MFHTNTSDQGCDSDGNTLSAGFLIAATSTTSSPGKYARLWRRSLTVSIFVSRHSTSSPSATYGSRWRRSLSDGSSMSPKKTNYSPAPITPATDPNSFLQGASNTNNSVRESGFFNFVSKAYNSFSSKSFSDEETSDPDYVPVPSSVDQGLGRNLSTQSRHTIDIPSVNEEEEKSEQQRLYDSVDRIVKQRDLNSLKEFGGIEKVASVFGSHLVNGIDAVQDRQVWDTNNPVPAKVFFCFLLKASNSYSIFLLLASAGLLFATGIMKQGVKYGWYDGAAVLLAVFILVTFPSVANFRRARKLEKKLWKERTKLEVEVIRSGRPKSITISNLVAGDIVRLKKGDQVPADGLAVNSNELLLDDVLNPKIDCERNPFLFYGSKVMDGHGSMLVTSVGDNRTLDKLLRLVIREPNEKMLLEAQMEKPNAFTENLSLFVSVLIALVAFIRLLCTKQDGDDGGFPEPKGKVPVMMKMFESILLKPPGKISILASALTVAVIAIQHGLPVVITISLSFWNEKLVIIRAKPQNLSASATMGIVTVLCIDATGGLVCGDTEVNKCWIGQKDVSNDGDSKIDQAVIEALKQGIGASVLVRDISVSPTNDLFISWAKVRWQLDFEFLDKNLSMLQYRKSRSREEGFGILLENNGNEETSLHIHWSGAGSTILDMCSHYYDSQGKSLAIGDDRCKFQEMIKNMEDSGLRPIAFACRKTEVVEIKEDGLHLLALAGLKYSCPEGIKLEVEALKKAGVRLKLVSEDEFSAVRAIGWELGIFRPEANDVALEGEQIRGLTTTERIEKIDQMTVMGRCLAEDKLLLIQSLQQKGHVVAFFGGLSTFDSPALKSADVGITEDRKCTEMARESSDIVISAKGSLPQILMFGRCAYHSIQKFTQLQLTVCVSGLLITMVTTVSLEESPLTTIQLIWVNWIVCLLGGLMTVMEIQGQEINTNPPAKRMPSLLTKVMWRNIVIQVLCQAFVLLMFEFKGQSIPSMSNNIRRTIIFSSFTLCQAFNQCNAMGLAKKEVLTVVLRNYTFLVTLGTLIVTQVLVVEFAKSLDFSIHEKYEKLSGMQWGVCFILAALPCAIHLAINFNLRFFFKLVLKV